MPVTASLPEISQYALTRFEQCPRLFELGHVQRAGWPAPDPMDEDPELRRRLGVGDWFHKLVHWHARGHDVTPYLHVLDGTEGAADLRAQWAAFLASPHARTPAGCWSEQTLRVRAGGLRVLVRYDRLARQDDGTWLIVDWKTGRSFDPATAARSWQTRLYRLALATGGAVFNGGEVIAPEAISVAYWHVPAGQAHVFPYSEALRAEDEAALADVAARLQAGLSEGFSPNETHCGRCLYRTRCQLGAERPEDPAPPLVLPTFHFPV